MLSPSTTIRCQALVSVMRRTVGGRSGSFLARRTVRGVTDVRLRLLGAVELRVDGIDVPLGPARQRTVLAALAVDAGRPVQIDTLVDRVWGRSEEHTSELQSRRDLVCRLLLEKKKKKL